MHSTRRRKAEHIDICLHEDVTGKNVTTGFEKYRLCHHALPEIDFAEISLSTTFFEKTLEAPFVVSSMTGGTAEGWEINKHLALAAEAAGWAMGVGSVRAGMEHPEIAYTYQLRKFAPSIPILANLGAVQLNYGYGIEECQRAVELVEADALIFHLNSLQEVFQPEGNTNFHRLLPKIEDVCTKLSVPVGVKEVGLGINGDTARQLFNAGIQFIDVAGAGGTSWIQVEAFRTKEEWRRTAAESFADWGIPTADCIIDVRQKNPDAFVIGSGGITNGVDAAKAISLGADLVSFGRSLLPSASESSERVSEMFRRLTFELKAAMFGIGVKTVSELKLTDRINPVPHAL